MGLGKRGLLGLNEEGYFGGFVIGFTMHCYPSMDSAGCWLTGPNIGVPKAKIQLVLHSKSTMQSNIYLVFHMLI